MPGEASVELPAVKLAPFVVGVAGVEELAFLADLLGGDRKELLS